MLLLVIAFFSGVFTVLSPYVLPILPMVLGASAEDNKNKWIPYIIIGSLSLSILVFSLLLKVSTIFIGVSPLFWKIFSGGLIVGLGLITVFPNIWKTFSLKIGLSKTSSKFLDVSSRKKGNMKYVFMGGALGPVFSGCSSTYAFILAIILPTGFIFGMGALLLYILGLAIVLLIISLLGKKFIKKLGIIANNGWLKRVVFGII